MHRHFPRPRRGWVYHRVAGLALDVVVVRHLPRRHSSHRDIFFEESKYVPILNSQEITASSSRAHDPNPEGKDDLQKPNGTSNNQATPREPPRNDQRPRPNSYRQRLALYTKTDESLIPYFRHPVIAISTFPAVAYTAITYGTTLAWFAIFTSIQATYLIQPPYSFDATGVGLMNVAPFIGGVVGFFLGGYLSDRMIVLLSKRNGGIYEPEMRLWLALPIAITNPASLLMLGLGLAYVCPAPSSPSFERNDALYIPDRKHAFCYNGYRI